MEYDEERYGSRLVGDLRKAAHRYGKLIGSLAGDLENSEQTGALVAAGRNCNCALRAR
jgi:hypothetical protein